MTDILLDAFGDLDLSTGDLQLVTGVDAIVQDLRSALRFVRGEWFLDQRIGVPYFKREDFETTILGVKNPNLAAIRGLYSRTILAVPGVLRLDSLAVLFDRAVRTLTVNFSALVEGSDTPLAFSEEIIL